MKYKGKDDVNNAEKDRYSARLSSTDLLFADNNRKLEIDHEKNKNEEGDDEEEEAYQNIVSNKDTSRRSTRKSYPDAIRDMMTPRQTATVEHTLLHVPSTKEIQDQDPVRDSSSSKCLSRHEEKPDQQELALSIDRAMKVTHRTTSNAYKSLTEGQPFSFRRLLSSSRSGQRLIDICFRVVLGQTSDESKAKDERNKWSKVPVFLVTLVHDNQSATTTTTTTATTDKKKRYDDPFEALDYSPPVMERQLEEVRAPCITVYLYSMKLLLSEHTGYQHRLSFVPSFLSFFCIVRNCLRRCTKRNSFS